MLAFVLKNWKILTFAGAALAIFGFGWGAWLFIDNQVDKREAAERRAAVAEQEARELTATALEDASRIVTLNARIALEAEAARQRFTEQQQRAEAAELRARKSQGLVNDLRSRLEADAQSCDCGIGPDLTERLRLDREQRAAQGGTDGSADPES